MLVDNDFGLMCCGVAGYSLSYHAVSMVICEQECQYLRVNMLVKGMHLNVCPAISASSVETIIGNFGHSHWCHFAPTRSLIFYIIVAGSCVKVVPD